MNYLFKFVTFLSNFSFFLQIIQMDQSYVSTYNSELDTTEEFMQSFGNLSTNGKTFSKYQLYFVSRIQCFSLLISDVKSNGGSSKRKLRNFQRTLNRKIRPDNYIDLKKQLEIGCQHWKTFQFDKERIIRHLQ